MSNEVAGGHTNGTLDDDGNREIKGHLLFEIATEVANRGQYSTHRSRLQLSNKPLKWEASIQSSNQKLQSLQQNMEKDIHSLDLSIELRYASLGRGKPAS